MRKACALCLQEKKLCRSHIIPEFLYTKLYDDKHRITILGKAFDRTKYQQKGLREYLLCEGCELTLSRYEKYVGKLLDGRAAVRKRQSARLYTMEEVDYSKFRLFGLSLLWRAGVAESDFFVKVQLGPHQEVIRKMILNGDPGEPDNYGFFLGRILSSELQPEAMMMQPTISRFEGHKCYRFVFGGFVWVFVVSSHGLSEVAKACMVTKGGSTIVVEHQLESIKFMMRGITAIGKRMSSSSYRH